MIPGVSRSGASIVGGMSQKLSRTTAAEFSFFLAVPTMMAASVKSFYDACKSNYLIAHQLTEEQAKATKISALHDIFGSENLHALFTHHNLLVFAIGCLISFLVALMAVKFFINYLTKHGFRLFGIYRILLGVSILVVLHVFAKI